LNVPEYPGKFKNFQVMECFISRKCITLISNYIDIDRFTVDQVFADIIIKVLKIRYYEKALWIPVSNHNDYDGYISD